MRTMRSTPAIVVHLAAGRGRDHHQLGHPRGLRRDGVHQHRGRVGRLAARNIEAHAIERGDLLAEHRAVARLDAPRVLALPVVEGANARGRGFERLTLFGADPPQGRVRRLRRHDEFGGIRGLPAIETGGVLEQGGIAARAHLIEDRGHGTVDTLVLRALEIEQRRELRVEGRVGGIEAARLRHGRPCPEPRSAAP